MDAAWPAKIMAVSLAAALFVLAGCTPPNAFEEFDIDRTSLSADATQRVIVSANRGRGPDGRRIVCAEPSPDAITAMASALGVGVRTGIPGTGATPIPLDAQFQQALAQQVAYVGVRNSTIQLLRDGLYRACEAYMNGAVGDFGYALILSNYGRLMVALLAAEGVTRAPFTGPTVLGSRSDAGNGAGDANGTSDGSARGSGGSAGSAGARRASAGGSGTPGASEGGGNWPSDTSINRILNTVDELAGSQASKDSDILVACLMWSDRSSFRSDGVEGSSLDAFCREVIGKFPGDVGEANKSGAWFGQVKQNGSRPR